MLDDKIYYESFGAPLLVYFHQSEAEEATCTISSILFEPNGAGYNSISRTPDEMSANPPVSCAEAALKNDGRWISATKDFAWVVDLNVHFSCPGKNNLTAWCLEYATATCGENHHKNCGDKACHM